MAVRDWAKLGTSRMVSWLVGGLTVSLLALMLTMPSRQPPRLLLFVEAITFVAAIMLWVFRAWGVLYLQLHPIPPGHCTACSYDLTGNVSGVCPECGKPTAATAQNHEHKKGG